MDDYEWDEKKRRINLTKHGIDFIDAVTLFNDPHRVEVDTHRSDEVRWVTMGIVNTVILVVVYTYRGKHRRIISARRASRDERKSYQAAKTRKNGLEKSESIKRVTN